MLSRETWTGPWAGLPVAWTDDDQFDEATYREDVARCCAAGIPGVYTGGTTGEFYALEWEEFERVSRATVETCHAHGTPAMIGCTATSTQGAARRAARAAELGADAIQVALPFWMEVPLSEIVPFFREVSRAAGDLPLSIYETHRARRTLTLEEHRAIHDAVPGYRMVKANAGTLGATPDGCRALSERVNVFAGEPRWAELGPQGIRGACSAAVYWNPRVVLGLWQLVETQAWDLLTERLEPLIQLHKFLATSFQPRGFTDTAYDRLMGRATGFLQTSLRNRAPYPSPEPGDVERVRDWLRKSYPELLHLEG